MLRKTPEGIYQSTLLMSIPGVVQGYSTRALGDMRRKDRQIALISRLKLSPKLLTKAGQVHGSRVRVVNRRDFGREIPQTDGLVSCLGGLLSVAVADCVPILAVDRQFKVIAVAHAGWRGTLGAVAVHLIETMKKIGAKPSRIFVSIGPHIGGCCYNVKRWRAKKFASAFGSKVAFPRGGKWYVDLALANCRQLVNCGILSTHIDVGESCTSCQNDEFYSYRKDTKETFGEILGFIGVRKLWKST